jgi:hypothetical protein
MRYRSFKCSVQILFRLEIAAKDLGVCPATYKRRSTTDSEEFAVLDLVFKSHLSQRFSSIIVDIPLSGTPALSKVRAFKFQFLLAFLFFADHLLGFLLNRRGFGL